MLPSLSDIAIPPWLKWLGALLVIVAIVAAIYVYGQQQFSLGEQAEQARWQARENQELVRANAEILRLKAAKEVAEIAHQQRMNAAATQFEQEKQREQAKSDAVIADLRTGAAGLWYHLAGGQGSGACGVGQAVAAAGGSDGGANAQLPPAVAEFLYAEADRADAITRQLGLAQQVIVEDRKVCGN